MRKTTKKNARSLIEKIVEQKLNSVERREEYGGQRITFSSPSYSESQRNISDSIFSIINNRLAQTTPHWIKGSGGNISVKDGSGTVIQVSKFNLNSGVVGGGKFYTLKNDYEYDMRHYLMTGRSQAKPGDYFVMLDENGITISRFRDWNKGCLGKVVIPSPLTYTLRDDKSWKKYIDESEENIDVSFNESWGYIVSARDPFFNITMDNGLDDYYMEFLEEGLKRLDAKNITGELVLTEGLTLKNIQGTMEADSKSILFKNSDGEILAEYGATSAHIGNILLYSDRIQSRNFNTGSAGFQINQTGDAEFNDVTVRGDLMGNKTNYADDTAGIFLEKNLVFIK
jgi:hypothetical protein